MSNAQPHRGPRGEEAHQHAGPAAANRSTWKPSSPSRPPTSGATFCAVAAASCILENVVAFEIAAAVVDKFGGDSLEEIQARLRLFHEMARKKLKE